jgi:hypothetical protein
MGTREFGREPLAVDMTKERDFPWVDADIDWCRVATDRAATIIRQTRELEWTSRKLRDARFQRDIYWPLGFCVGVLCGLGLAVLL